MAGDAGKARSLHVRCEDCGADYPDFEWLPGVPCPRCRSNRFEPVVEIGSVSDYEGADRSKGFAIEDIRFGRLAQWAEMISPKQLERALFLQSQRARQSSATPDLASWFIKEKAITRRQAEAIHANRRIEPGNTDDIEFGLAAVRLGYVSEARLAACRGIQQADADGGRDAPPLPLLLFEKRYAKESQILALLKNFERQGKGLLFHIKRDAGMDTLVPHRGGRMKTWVSDPLVQTVALAASLLITALLVYRFYVAAPSVYANVRCAHCGAEGGAPARSKWPLECPQCKQREMYPLAICLTCATRFPVTNALGYGVRCPKCGASTYRLITNQFKVEDLEVEIKTRGASASE